MHLRRSALWAATLSLLLANQCFALRTNPSDLAALQELKEDNGPQAIGKPSPTQYNILNIPIFVEMAKSAAAYQARFGLFVQSGPYNHYPSINLTRIFLKRSGPLSISQLPSESTEGVRLSMEEMSKANTETPGNVQTNSFNSIKAKSEQAGAPLSISFVPIDALGTSKGNSPIGLNSTSGGLSLNLPNIATTENPAFMLWTCHENNTYTSKAKDDSEDAKSFGGSFLACIFGTKFNTITGRTFSLQSGKVLVVNRGPEMVIETPECRIIFKHGAAGLITAEDKKPVIVQALQASGNNLYITSGDQNLKLSSGEQIDVTTGTGSLKKKMIKPFSVEQTKKQELLLSNSNSELNNRQKVALNEFLQELNNTIAAQKSAAK
jgi:hypothetical protein